MMTDLEKLPPGRTCRVLDCVGGRGMRRKLDAMGLRPGKEVRKLSSQFMAGPVTILVDGRQVAMGRGIARKIRVEALD
jgi:ferrous iron transport protein A